MRISRSIFLIALGAILRFAVSVTTRGFNLHTIGVILMVVGAGALLIALAQWNQRSRAVPPCAVDGVNDVTEERRISTYHESQSRPYGGPSQY
jgi:Domain of unknown function (DUF6458)